LSCGSYWAFMVFSPRSLHGAIVFYGKKITRDIKNYSQNGHAEQLN
jgi:hypothetical protein